MKIIGLFNNKGGVGKTSLTYHLAHMFALQGVTTLVADLDPQANLTASFLTETELEALWTQDDNAQSIFQGIKPMVRLGGMFAWYKLLMMSSKP